MSHVNYLVDDRLGWTPLHIAAKNNRERVVLHLLAAGADAALRDSQGRTARDLSSDPAIRRLLENDDWLEQKWPVVAARGNGLITGEKLRQFYKQSRKRLSKEKIDPVWGGLLGSSCIQPDDFDSFCEQRVLPP